MNPPEGDSSSSNPSAHHANTPAPLTRQPPTRTTSTNTQRTSPFRIPPPLRTLFDRFPLHTYPANTLPRRSPSDPIRRQNTLYIFSDPNNTNNPTAPSPNPTCLKWQTALHIAGIPFTTVTSTNHASPSGNLPFFVPANSAATAVPLTSSTLPRWVRLHSPNDCVGAGIGGKETPTEKFYTTLLTHNVRLAYLYTLYLQPSTFSGVAKPVYVDTASASSFVRTWLEPSLRQAALEEVLKEGRGSEGGIVDVEGLFRGAEEACGALSVLLGEGVWFGEAVGDTDGGVQGEPGGDGSEENGRMETERSRDEFAAQGGSQSESGMGLFDDYGEGSVGEAQANSGAEASASAEGGSARGPGMLDAAVFSYMHLILRLFEGVSAGAEERWSPAGRLVEAVKKHVNLVWHRERVLEGFFDNHQAR